MISPYLPNQLCFFCIEEPVCTSHISTMQTAYRCWWWDIVHNHHGTGYSTNCICSCLVPPCHLVCTGYCLSECQTSKEFPDCAITYHVSTQPAVRAAKHHRQNAYLTAMFGYYVGRYFNTAIRSCRHRCSD